MYSAYGRLQYNDNWIILTIPKSIGIYYKWWVEKFTGKKTSSPLHGFHCTVVAGKYQDVSRHPLWGIHNNEKVLFYYDSRILTNDEGYFWLSIFCHRLAEVRRGLSLTDTPKYPYHCTISYLENVK